MAVTFNSDSMGRAGALYADVPENIFIDAELNGRVETTEVETLAADIALNGQNTPVVVRKDDAGNPVLVCGHRRWRAVTLLNKGKKEGEKVKLLCSYQQLEPIEALIMAIGENRFRKDVTPVDDAHNIALLQKKFNKTVEDIAVIYFPEKKSPDAKADAIRWVKDRVALQELAPEAEQAVRDGSLKITAAKELAKLSKDQQRAVVKEDKGKLKGKSRIKVSAVKAAKKPVKSAKPEPKAAKALATKVPSSVYEAAENMAKAIDVWIEDATNFDKTEKAIISAHKAYRKLVPLRSKKAA